MKSIRQSNMLGRFLRFIEERSGVSTVEYALIVVAVIAIVGGGMLLLGGNFKTLFKQIGTDMTAQKEAMKKVFPGHSYSLRVHLKVEHRSPKLWPSSSPQGVFRLVTGVTGSGGV